MSSPRIGVIVVAAGSSQRMEGVDKLWVDLGGLPVLGRTVEALATALPDAYAVVVSSPRTLALVAARALIPDASVTLDPDRWPWRFVARWIEGGAHRQDSVYAGLCALAPCDIVLIHDGARPLVTVPIVATGVRAALSRGAATAGVPITDTIKVVDPATSLVVSTPDRATLWAVQTPQVFAYHVIVHAYAQLGAARTTVTDDAALVERCGHPVQVFPGSPRNIKVSTPADLALVRALWAEQATSC